MSWEIVAAATRFPELTADWDRLNNQLYNGHPFFDSRFIGALLVHFGSGNERLCIHRTSGLVTGALILVPSGRGRWALFRPAQVQASALLLSDVGALETLFAALPGLVWTVELYAVDPRFAPDFTALKLPQVSTPQAHTIGVQVVRDFNDYWAKRARKLAHNLRRYFRRVESEGYALRFLAFRDEAEIAARVGRYGTLESAGWKGRAGTAISRENTQGAFYEEVLRGFAATGQAAVYELQIGDHLAASRLMIANAEMLILLKTTYDESLSRFAPGRLLLYQLLEEQFRHPTLKTIEFYTNATTDQKEWATFGCTIRNIQIFRSPVVSAAFSILRANRNRFRSSTSEPSDHPQPIVQTAGGATLQELRDASWDVASFRETETFETSADWFTLLQREVFPDDPGVRFYLTGEKQQPRVILPVRLTQSGQRQTMESLSNYYTALYAPMLSREGDLLDLQDLVAAATREHPNLQVMRFAPMDPEATAYPALINALRANNWVPFGYFCFGNWYLRVNGTWSDYLQQRSAAHRSAIRRRCRRFKADGGTLRMVTTAQGIDEAVTEFESIYLASWKRPEPYPDFVPALIRCLAATGKLRLGLARLGEQTIAAQLWFVDGAKASIYKVAYHEQFASYSPGTVLTAHLMQHVIDVDRVKKVDFLIGDDEYKHRWMSHRRERWGIVAYNPATLPGLALFFREVCGRLAKAAKRGLSGAWRRWRKQPADAPAERS
ncbi:MAG: GNAT family N-acetyltransferase [Elusimicrobia bacterium]|nr:MAG: GNAT family N-acetyltransferase [Elusimicrobiota bacterium]